MAIGKWIGGFLGLLGGGPLGMLAGIVLGALADSVFDSDNYFQPGDAGMGGGSFDSFQQRRQQGERNGFLFSLMVLVAHIIHADGRVMHSEMEYVRQTLRTNFGEQAVHEGEQILLKLFEKQKELGAMQYRSVIESAARQIAANMDYSTRMQLLNFLVIQ